MPKQAISGETDEALIYCAEAAPKIFDPGSEFDGPMLAMVSLPIFDRLVDYEPGTTDLVPALSESWTVSEDGKVYTFKLRSNVHFHSTDWFTPSRPMNADDVVFSFRRQLDEKHPWFGENEVGAYGPIAEMRDIIERIEAVDDVTVEFQLTQPFSPFISNLGIGLASIVSAEYANAVDADGDRSRFIREPVGTGPFRFESDTLDVAIRYSANSEYWGPLPRTPKLIASIVTDQAVRTQKVVSGECHIAPYPTPAEIERLKKLDNVRVAETAGLNFAFLAFNTLQPPFDDPQVRRAVAMSIDKETIIEVVYSGRAQSANTPVPPGLWAHAEGLAGVGYDPATATKIIEAKGLRGTKLKLWAMPVQRDYNPNGRRMAEIIAADLEKIGIEPEIVSYEWADYLKRSRDPKRDGAVFLGWVADTIDPVNFLGTMFTCGNVGGTNRSQWCDERYDSLIEQSFKTADRQARIALYKKAQALLMEEMPLVPIAYARVADIMTSNVRGFVQEPMGWHRFHRAYLEGD
jgi:dipeptide transport system substrate-binding protein